MQRRYYEECGSRWDLQEVSHHLWKSKFKYHIHKNPSLVLYWGSWSKADPKHPLSSQFGLILSFTYIWVFRWMYMTEFGAILEDFFHTLVKNETEFYELINNKVNANITVEWFVARWCLVFRRSCPQIWTRLRVDFLCLSRKMPGYYIKSSSSRFLPHLYSSLLLTIEPILIFVLLNGVFGNLHYLDIIIWNFSIRH